MIGGLVLAAGEGRRFGGPKQLAELDGEPLLAHAVRAMTAVETLERVVVVLGARAAEVRGAVDFGRAEVVVCADWAEGMSASLRTGIDALADTEAIVLTLGDQPDITAEAIALFAAEQGTCRAGYDGVPGHPVRLDASMAARARTLTGPDGARELLRGCRLVECSDLCRPDDVDTPDQLEALVTSRTSMPSKRVR